MPMRIISPLCFQEMCRHMEIPLVAVDEAHCISQWGQDFRPNYLKIPEFICSLEKRPTVGAFTATATPNVRKDILENLQLKEPLTVTTGFDRPNLSFSVYQPKDRDKTLSELLRDRYRQSGIIYCATRKNVEAVCAALDREGFSVTRYHAGLAPEERRQNQEDFLFDRKRVMVATNAFGMGIDKSNVSYVIHYNMPKSLEAYYQEAGRAGRDGCDADCILLYASQDVVTAHWLIDHSEPNPDLSPEEQAEVRAKDEERLKWMIFYAKSRKPDCEHTDITTEAQMILSCVARTEQKYSGEVIIKLLRGEMPSTMPESFDPAELTTFGLMNDVEESAIREAVRALLEQGYLESGENGCLKLNDQSREVLFKQRRVAVKRGLKNRMDVTGEDLFQALQRLRFEISAREYIAASTLFSDATLRDLCRVLPRNKKQLAAVDGMGLFKAGKYGDAILRMIRYYAPEPEKQKAAKEENRGTGKFQTYKDKVIARGNTEAYQSWSKKEDDQLLREQADGRTVREMSAIHKRTEGAIRSRLKKLELKSSH